MDNFKLILGLEFLRDTKTTVLPFSDSLMMMESKPCVISTLVEKMGREEHLSHVVQNRPAVNRINKEGESLEWSSQCQAAFKKLKESMWTDPVLALPDMAKAFEMHTDASDFALGGVLIQEGHPVAYESRKLNNAERRYSAHKKELLAVVHCLRV
ncbi:reverse transcriptase [Abeliophyllum distichum]|uniref:Reverse transcriptase n=1 Tax=Abeliophyllum distichum TaxID=126358 RepID=A0ABD1T1S6_9LAMI